MSCSTKQEVIEIDYRAINCAGWDRVTLSRKDVVSRQTKEEIAAHNLRYMRVCELKEADHGK